MVDDIWLRASDRKAFGRLSAEKAFLSVCCGIQLQPLQPLQPFCNLGNAMRVRCQDLQFVTSPVSKWWLRAPASRAGGSAAARHWPGTASASSLQPRPQPVPMDCWARGGAAARPHLSAATTVPQSMACQSAAAGNLGPVRSRSPSTNETNDTAFALNRQSAPIGVAALNDFGWRKRRYIKRTVTEIGGRD